MLKAELNIPLTDELLEDIELFLYRASELHDNYKELLSNGLSFNGSHSVSNDNGKISGVSLDVCKHRLKGLFLDFRFFIANDEPTNFLKVTRVLGKYSNNTNFRGALAEQRKQWKDPGMLKGWIDCNACDLITTYFNSQAFHGRHIKEKEYKYLVDSFNPKTLEWILVFYISDRINCIKNMRILLSSYKEGHFWAPDTHQQN